MSRTLPTAIMLPPSEGKAEGGDGPPWDPWSGTFGARLGACRAQLADALAELGGGDQKLLGVGGAHLTRAQSANASLLGSPTLPAGRRYTGVVWDHLGLATLPAPARRRAVASIVVLSGLLGAVTIDDPIPDYRLKMGASLAPFGKLSTWWRGAVSAALDDHLAKRHVIDLLPNEHAAAWTPDAGRFASLTHVTFVERSGKVAGHDAKAAKGLLARHLVLSGGDPRKALATFEHPRFELDLS